MYASYRNYYRNRFGFFNDSSERRATTAGRPRPRWRYNRTRPTYDHDTESTSWFFDFNTGPTQPERPGSAPAIGAGAEPAEGSTGGGSGDPAPTEPTPTEPQPAAPIEVPSFNVLDVGFFKRSNSFLHHTDRYEHGGPIIRRGQEFKMKVKVDKEFTKGEDDIKLQFGMGTAPMESKGTMFIITPGESLELDDASAIIKDVKHQDGGSIIILGVNFPCDCVVGRFTLVIRLRNKEDSGRDGKYVKHKADKSIVVLFNPWCKDDAVYMEDEKLLAEYVLAQTGQIFTGNSAWPRPRAWSFGQFEKASLKAALHILDKSSMPWEAYGNPVRVTRCVSAMVNSNDGDGGILTGNWSGNYEGGTRPTEWNGSVGILDKYMETKKQVNYGQCWVFSGVTTTICRALGIPTRSVTNFDSAHDTDASMTIDYHQDTEGSPLKHLNDSVWNFHVWNEAWFKRPDLPEGNDGWQAFDATPQEHSDGVMQCGPAPLAAIKEGNVHVGHDTMFIFAEVNGDKVTWEVNGIGEKKVIKVDKDGVGAKISTKAVGKKEREDVTNLYKYEEGGTKERSVVRKVTQMSSRRKGLEAFYKLDQINDVDMEFKGKLDEKANGHFSFTAKNTSSEKRTVTARCHLVAKYYTGIDGEDIDSQTKVFNLEPNTEDQFSWEINAADWLNKIDEDATIGAYCDAKVAETKQNYIKQDTYYIEKPELEINLSKSSVKVLEEVEAEIKFKNPLDISLTKASFMVEGAGLSKAHTIQISGEIAPDQMISEKLTLTPKIAGELEIIASFNSRQLVDFTGSAELQVEGADSNPEEDPEDDVSFFAFLESDW